MANSSTLLSFPTPRAKPLIFSDISTERLLKQVERLAPSDASVLIVGESGTGK